MKSSLMSCNFLHSQTGASLLGPDVFLGILSSDACNKLPYVLSLSHDHRANLQSYCVVFLNVQCCEMWTRG
jgi:hypothetical protein